MARTEIRGDGIVRVALSERNLLSLLAKLHTPGSARTITNNDIVDTDPTGGGIVLLAVSAESDEEHYASLTRGGAPAGEMHPHTERILEIIKRVMRDEPAEGGT